MESIPFENQHLFLSLCLAYLTAIFKVTFCAARVSDVSKDVAAMRKYLMNDLGFKEDVANALLDSSYSVRVVSQSVAGRMER